MAKSVPTIRDALFTTTVLFPREGVNRPQRHPVERGELRREHGVFPFVFLCVLCVSALKKAVLTDVR